MSWKSAARQRDSFLRLMEYPHHLVAREADGSPTAFLFFFFKRRRGWVPSLVGSEASEVLVLSERAGRECGTVLLRCGVRSADPAWMAASTWEPGPGVGSRRITRPVYIWVIPLFFVLLPYSIRIFRVNDLPSMTAAITWRSSLHRGSARSYSRTRWWRGRRRRRRLLRGCRSDGWGFDCGV